MDKRKPIEIGSERKLFLNNSFVARKERTTLRLHTPERRETALQFNTAYYPWEGESSWCPTLISDGGLFKMFYRAASHSQKTQYTAVAESVDGIHWRRPTLGIIEHDGSTQNNLVLSGFDGGGRGMAMVFLDSNPDAPADERYKAIGRCTEGVTALGSADGYHWRTLTDEPILSKKRLIAETNDRHWDSPNVGLWDPWREEYVIYMRGWPEMDKIDRSGRRAEIVGGPPDRDHFRWIRRSTSPDFRNWTTPEYIDTGDVPYEQFYTNSCIAYERSKNTYLMFPKRFVETRTRDPEWWGGPGQSDIVFMSSDDGMRWDRSFMEAFIRPGPNINNWHERSIAMATGILHTSPTELSMYMVEHYRTPTERTVRLVLRPDGFVSLHADYDPGSAETVPFTFAGSELTINFSTSAVGYVKAALCDEQGEEIPGYSIDECDEMWGDEIERKVSWTGGKSDVSRLAGSAVFLRFEMKDSDVYSFRFS